MANPAHSYAEKEVCEARFHILRIWSRLFQLVSLLELIIFLSATRYLLAQEHELLRQTVYKEVAITYLLAQIYLIQRSLYDSWTLKHKSTSTPCVHVFVSMRGHGDSLECDLTNEPCAPKS